MIITNNDEYFYSVSGLMVPKNTVSDTINEDIEHFVDWVSKNTQVMETLVSNNHINTEMFTRRMDELYCTLCSIYANWLSAEAARILKLISIENGDVCKKLIAPFLSNVRTLALDIQMAQSNGFVNSYRKREEIEQIRNVVISMKTVLVLLESSHFEKAYEIAVSIEELKGSDYAKRLIDDITSEKYFAAINTATEIIQVYTRKIDVITDDAKSDCAMKTLLIVDDMPEILTAIRHMLSGHYQVVGFSDGGEALSFIDNIKSPDAFLLDIEMPEMDGFKLAQSIRERAKFKNTPIIFLTGNSTRLNLIKALKYGIKAFIVKPAYKDILISKLSSCL